MKFDPMTPCRRLAEAGELEPLSVYNFIFGRGMEGPFDEGKVSSQEFYEAVKNGLGLRLGFEEFSQMWCDIFEEDAEVSRLIGLLKGQHKLYLLSNTNALHFQFIEERFGVIREFDELVLSFQVRLRKPDPRIFGVVLDKSRAAPEKHLFIDDNQANVEAAQSLGMCALQFKTAGELREELLEAGLLY